MMRPECCRSERSRMRTRGGTEREAQLKILAIAAAQPRGQRYRQVAKRARVFVVFSAEEVCRIEDRARLPSRYPLQFFFCMGCEGHDYGAGAFVVVPAARVVFS